MKSIAFLLLFCLFFSISSFAQAQYPIFYQAGTKIEHKPVVNVYIISETQLDSSLKINELYKNSEQRIELLKLKITQQDSIIKLNKAIAANFDSTLTHTQLKLAQCTDESQVCQRELVKQKSCKKKLMGIAGLEAIILLLVIAL